MEIRKFLESIIDKKIKDQFLVNCQLYFDHFDKNIMLTNNEFRQPKREFTKVLYLTTKQIIQQKDVLFGIGKKFFYNTRLKIQPGVYVPQFDSEVIIDVILADAKKLNYRTGIDIGTGTGALAISIAKNSEIQMVGVDINPSAIEVSKQNNELNNTKVSFVHRDIKELEIAGKFDFAVCNPPYIAFDDDRLSSWVIYNQPKEALYAEEYGTAFIKWLLENAHHFIKKNGKLYFEIGDGQESLLTDLLADRKVAFHNDLGGVVRFIEITI